jgi:DNA-binding transcriptional LysR family regulator
MSRAGLVELNAVVAVAAHRSFRAAATELAMSPSALSHAIAALEQRLGVRVFHRTTRSVALSEAGEQFLARVRPALREITDAMEAASESRAVPSGTLRLNTSDGAATLILPAALELGRRFPELSVEIVTHDGLIDIVADGFDAGVRLAESVPKDMVAVAFGADLEMAVVGTPGYFKRHPAPRHPRDLADHVCIRRRWPSGALYRWDFEKRRKEIAVDVAGPFTFDRDGLTITAALAGAGLAYVSLHAVQADLARGRLVRALADWTPAYPGLRLYYPSRRHIRPALRAFVAVLREVLPAPRRSA